MQCPKCQSHSLKPIQLQYGLSARQCNRCEGVLIDLLAYRKWAEDFNQVDKTHLEEELLEIEDSSSALLCSKCSRLMLKFHVADSTKNKVDLCTACDEAWLDNGEWELLGALNLQGKLNKIFTEPWQKHIRDELSNKAFKKQFEDLLGVDDYQKLLQLKSWIESHENKADLIRYLLKA